MIAHHVERVADHARGEIVAALRKAAGFFDGGDVGNIIDDCLRVHAAVPVRHTEGDQAVAGHIKIAKLIIVRAFDRADLLGVLSLGGKDVDGVAVQIEDVRGGRLNAVRFVHAGRLHVGAVVRGRAGGGAGVGKSGIKMVVFCAFFGQRITVNPIPWIGAVAFADILYLFDLLRQLVAAAERAQRRGAGDKLRAKGLVEQARKGDGAGGHDRKSRRCRNAGNHLFSALLRRKRLQGLFGQHAGDPVLVQRVGSVHAAVVKFFFNRIKISLFHNRHSKNSLIFASARDSLERTVAWLSANNVAISRVL